MVVALVVMAVEVVVVETERSCSCGGAAMTTHAMLST